MKNYASVKILSFIAAIIIHLAIYNIYFFIDLDDISHPHYYPIELSMVAPSIDSSKINKNPKKQQSITKNKQKIKTKDQIKHKLKDKIIDQKQEAKSNLDLTKQQTTGKIAEDATQKNSAIVKKISASYLKNPAPKYPNKARILKQEGTVILDVLIDKDGKLKEVSIFKSSQYELLDQAALQTVKNWEFVPAKYGDKNIESNVKIPIKFKIDHQN